jgi:hypothetical protein
MIRRATGISLHEKSKEHLSAQSKKAESQRPAIAVSFEGRLNASARLIGYGRPDSSRDCVSWSF